MPRFAAAFFIVVTVLLAGHPCAAEPSPLAAGTLAWEAAYPAEPDGSGRAAEGCALDADGMLYVTGYVEGKGGNFDTLLVKYGPDGRMLWSRRYDYSWHDVGNAVAVDADGNALVAASSNDIDLLSDMAFVTYHTVYVLLKYSPDGALEYDAPARGYYKDNEPSGIVAGPDGRAYITGDAQVPAGTRTVYYTVCFTGDGELDWERPDDWGTASSTAHGMYVDADGGVVVSGSCFDQTTEHYYIRTVKYTPDGLHALADVKYRPEDELQDVMAHALAPVPGGGFVVAGSTTEDGGTTLVVYYGPDLSPLWTARYSGILTKNEASAVAVDAYGRTYVLVNTHRGDRRGEPILLVYSRDGGLLAENFLDLGGDYSLGNSLAVGPDGALTVAGTSFAADGQAVVRVLRFRPFTPGGAGPDGVTLQGPDDPLSVELTTSPDEQSGAGGVTFYARVAGTGTEGDYEYRFFVPGAKPDAWEPVTGYSTKNFWSATGKELAGVERVMVQVRPSGSFMGYDAKAELALPKREEVKAQ